MVKMATPQYYLLDKRCCVLKPGEAKREVQQRKLIVQFFSIFSPLPQLPSMSRLCTC